MSVTHKQSHRYRRISAQNVKNVLKYTPITVSLPGNAVLRHNYTLKFHLARNLRIPSVFQTSSLPVSINVLCSRGITTSRSWTRFPFDQYTKWMQVLHQYHAAAPPFVCVTLVKIGRSANVKEFSLLVRNPSVSRAISMVSNFWNICRVMSSPEVLWSRKHLGFADYERGGTFLCICAVKRHYQVTKQWWEKILARFKHSERRCASCDDFVCDRHRKIVHLISPTGL